MGYEAALSLLRKGRANPSDYLVSFPTKVLQNAPSNDFGDYVSYFTRAVALPATNNSTIGVMGHEFVGIKRNVITGRNYGSPVVMTFTERSDMIIYSTIKGWIDSSVLNSEQGGSRGGFTQTSNAANRNLRVQYYDTTKCDIEIYKLEPIQKDGSSGNREDFASGASLATDGSMRGHTPTAKWTLINAMPLAIEQSTMSVEAADSLLDFTMSIAYESFKYETLDTLGEGISRTTLNNRN